VRLIDVKVTPNARRTVLEPAGDGTWVAHLQAPPVDGKANEALVRLVAEHFGVRRSQVRLRSGATARRKRLEIDGLDP
jgi:hypothetical protein